MLTNYEEIFKYYEDLKNRNVDLKEDNIKSALQKNGLETSKQKINNSGIAYGGTYKEVYDQKKSKMEDNLDLINKNFLNKEEDLQNTYISNMKKAFHRNESNKIANFTNTLGTISSWFSKLVI